MAWQLPEGAPKTTSEAFAYIGGLSKGATLDDVRILAMVEAIGKELYDELASRTENPEAAELLRQNGREELLHAHRCAQAVEILSGTPFPIPPLSEIPFFTPLSPMPVTKAAMAGLAEAELAGGDLYAGIAASFDNPEAKALFAQNGREELEHGQRLQRVAELLAE